MRGKSDGPGFCCRHFGCRRYPFQESHANGKSSLCPPKGVFPKPSPWRDGNTHKTTKTVRCRQFFRVDYPYRSIFTPDVFFRLFVFYAVERLLSGTASIFIRSKEIYQVKVSHTAAIHLEKRPLFAFSPTPVFQIDRKSRDVTSQMRPGVQTFGGQGQSGRLLSSGRRARFQPKKPPFKTATFCHPSLPSLAAAPVDCMSLWQTSISSCDLLPPSC